MSAFRRLAVTTAAATLVLVAVGALVRATGSGLGCLTSWPTCRGGWTAPPDVEGIIEYGHRTLAGVVVLLLAAQAILARRWVPGATSLKRWTDASVAIVLLQALLGRVVVTSELHAAWVTAHFILAMGLVAATTHVATRTFLGGRPRTHDKVAKMAVGALGGIFLVLVVGAYVRERGAGLAFADWPLMGGAIVPLDAGVKGWVHFTHRLLALLVAGHLVGLAMRTRADLRRAVRSLGWALLGLYGAQVLLGAANAWTELSPAAVMAHVVGGALTWSAAVALTTAARHGLPSTEPVPETARETEAPAPRGGGTLHAYVALMKPRIILLLLVTTVPAMVLAAGSMPSLWLVGATLLGGILTAGSANAINQYLERDIDAKMIRTKARPLPMHRVPPRNALFFGITIGIAGTAWLTVVVNALAAALAATAIAFYVVVYTVLLKRSTPQNIVIGGAAGAMPVLIGWAAVTGTVGLPAWILFAIVFVWTPPHFWALAMRHREDYERAGVPMLPVVRTPRQTTQQILAYTLLLVPVSLLLHPAAQLGLVYLATAVGLGAGFVWLSVALWRDPCRKSAMRLFNYSVNYLALLFVAIAVDRLVLR